MFFFLGKSNQGVLCQTLFPSMKYYISAEQNGIKRKHLCFFLKRRMKTKGGMIKTYLGILLGIS